MAEDVDDLMPALMRSIRDELRVSNHKLDKLDKLDSIDKKLDKLDTMDSKLDKIQANTALTHRSLEKLIDVIGTEVADQMADVRRRLSNIESHLGLDTA